MPLGMLGKYEKLDVLGHGASGIVYLAKDTLLNRQVAIKVVSLQAGEMQHFLEEARVLDRLKHPNIVRVHNVDRIDGNIVLDMEYVRGKNVQEMLREQGALPMEYALEIAAQTLDALQYAHEMQTVHRDIKPANILISRQGEVKLVDFGLAEILATNAYAGGAGTYAYMAPEDFAEEDRSDHQSDIWAVGVTLYEMLAGQRPFLVSKPKDPFAWKRVLDNELPTPISVYVPSASAGMQTIVNRALARDKSRRYQTAREFHDDLRRLQSGQAPSAVTHAVVPASPMRRAGGNGVSSAAPVGTLRHRISSQAAAPLQQTMRGERLSTGASAIATPDASTRTVRPAVRSRVISVTPEQIDFGSVRANSAREARVQVRSSNAQSATVGRILDCPEWITAHPTMFTGAKQVITLTARGREPSGAGEREASVCVEMGSDRIEIPVTVQFVAARPTFVQIAPWFVPIFAAVQLPIAALLYASGAPNAAQAMAPLVPAAAAASGLLMTMLLLIACAADIGIAERMACGLEILAMGAVLGVSSAHWQPGAFTSGMLQTLLTAVPIGGMLFLQLLSLSKWKWWAFVAGCTGVAVGAAFLFQLK